MNLTRPQREALFALWSSRGFADQAPEAVVVSYRDFRRAVQPEILSDTVLVPWCGMTVGIETDGYTHT